MFRQISSNLCKILFPKNFYPTVFNKQIKASCRHLTPSCHTSLQVHFRSDKVIKSVNRMKTKVNSDYNIFTQDWLHEVKKDVNYFIFRWPLFTMLISLSSVLSFIHFFFFPVYKTERKFNIPTVNDSINIISKIHVH